MLDSDRTELHQSPSPAPRNCTGAVRAGAEPTRRRPRVARSREGMVKGCCSLTARSPPAQMLDTPLYPSAPLACAVLHRLPKLASQTAPGAGTARFQLPASAARVTPSPARAALGPCLVVLVLVRGEDIHGRLHAVG